jgi:hypothetical protein
MLALSSVESADEILEPIIVNTQFQVVAGQGKWLTGL